MRRKREETHPMGVKASDCRARHWSTAGGFSEEALSIIGQRRQASSQPSDGGSSLGVVPRGPAGAGPIGVCEEDRGGAAARITSWQVREQDWREVSLRGREKKKEGDGSGGQRRAIWQSSGRRRGTAASLVARGPRLGFASGEKTMRAPGL